MSHPEGRSSWRPEATAAVVVVVIGFFEGVYGSSPLRGLQGLIVTLVVATMVGLCRRAPGVALGLLWALGAAHVLLQIPIMLVEFAAIAVFFGAARWGRVPVAACGGLSVPVGLVLGVLLAQERALDLGSDVSEVLRLSAAFGPSGRVVLLFTGVVLTAGAWPVGLVLRILGWARTSRESMLEAEAEAAGARRETEQAREIADLRDAQARLARDVHDVVGHSLAVILAQAESAQYVDDTGQLRKTMDTIATSARSSLQDVRHVLSPPPQASTRPSRAGDFDDLLAGVRRSGREVVVTESGPPRPLPPEIDTVAYRVLQEMFTNALKHGSRDQPILVERHWPATNAAGSFADTLRIEVRNETERTGTGGTGDLTVLLPDVSTGSGRGLDGMRRRLESVGGHLDVRRSDQPAGGTFTVTAWVPVRGRPR